VTARFAATIVQCPSIASAGGLVPGEHQVDGLAGDIERRVLQRPLGKHRRVSAGDQQHVALAQRHVEPFGEVQDHVAGRLRAPGLKEAQMLGRDLGLAGKIELAHAPPLAPFAQVIADWPDHAHGETLADRRGRLHYLAVNRRTETPC